jgi:hypothetical protein
VRVRLGETVDASEYSLGTKYLLTQTNPPSLELGPPDGTKATAWYYRSHQDGLERQPFNQIASSAVSDLQNIGDYSVWMYSQPLTGEDERTSLREGFAGTLNNATGNAAKRLHALIPAEWTAQAALDYDDELAAWKREGEPFEGRVARLNGQQAALLEKLRPQHGKLVELLKGQMGGVAKAFKAQGVTVNGRPPTEESAQHVVDERLLFGAQSVQRLEGKMERAQPQDQESLLEQQLDYMESFGTAELQDWLEGFELTEDLQEAFTEARSTEGALVEALKAEAPVRAWQRRAPLKGVARWNDHCGAKRYEGSTYRWDYDGTYITASDSETVPSEKTYWTDDNGRLVGKPKGSPGQKWTIAAYKEPADQIDGEAIFLTGMFGPLAGILLLG